MILVFDLDDTLYSEKSFAVSGFTAVASYLKDTHGVPISYSLGVMLEALDQGMRNEAFQRLILAKNLPNQSLQRMLAVYRKHEPNIALDPATKKVLKSFSTTKKYVVTDGNKVVQRNKINALGLDQIFERSLITHAFGLKASKPSTHCFEVIKKTECVEWKDMVYVGDDPKKDFVNLKPLGVTTVRVLTGRHAKIVASEKYDAEFHITSLEKLKEVLEFRYGVQPNSS